MMHPIPPTICLLLGLGASFGAPGSELTHSDPVRNDPPKLVRSPSRGVAPRAETAKGFVRADGMELRTIDVTELTTQLGNAPLPSLRLAISSGSSGELDLFGQVSPKWFFPRLAEHTIDGDRLQDLIRNVIAAETWENDGSSIESIAGRLEVVNESAVLNDIESFLETVRLSTAPTLRLRCIAWEPKDGTQMPAARHSLGNARDLARRLASGEFGKLVYDASTTCRSGSRERFGVTRLLRYQGDLACEVAQGIGIRAPQVRSVLGGHEFWVQPIVDSEHKGLSIFAYFRTCDVDEVDRVDLPRIDSSIELVTCPQGSGIFSAWLEGGGAIVTRVASHGVAIFCERVDPLPNRREGFRALAIGDVYNRNLHRINGELSDDTSFSIGYEGRDIDRVVDQVRAISQLGEQDGESADTTGWSIVMTGDEKKLATAERFVASLGRPGQQNYRIEIRREFNAAQQGVARWEKAVDPVEVTCMAGHVGSAVRGTQRSFVAASLVEIAQEFAMNDPVVESFFVGEQVIASVAPVGSTGEVRVELAVLVRNLLEMREVASPAEHNNKLHCPKTSEVFYTRKMRAKIGEATILGSGPTMVRDGVEHTTRIVMVVRSI